MDLRVEIDRMPLRRMCVLVAGLPPESAVGRDGGWTAQEHLTATLVEVTDLWGRLSVLLAGAGRKGFHASRLPKPVRITRPGMPEPQKKKVETDPRVIAAWFAQR